MRVLVAFFSFVVALITIVLIPVAYFGDKNEVATKRLIIIAGIAASDFYVCGVLVRNASRC
jgi:hypothetical protein